VEEGSDGSRASSATGVEAAVRAAGMEAAADPGPVVWTRPPTWVAVGGCGGWWAGRCVVQI
jgi:hypothetical protein